MELVAKSGDTAPLRRYQLTDHEGNPVNLTGATIVQRFDGAPVNGSPCTIDGAATDGIVRLASRADLPVPPAGRPVTFPFETEVTFADTTVQTFPETRYDSWVIWSDLDTS